MAYATIDKPSSYFNTVLYTGDGASPKSITGVGFKPDFVWSKQRSVAENHNLYDAVRGGANSLRSNLTNAENASSIYGYVSTFDSDGVTYISGGTNNDLNNGSGVTFVNWNWLGANTTVSNTSGSITSTVSANTTSGFSIVTYTGNGTTGATIGHGLGVAPRMIIIKNRVNAYNWIVYHASLGNTGDLKLQSTGAFGIDINDWNNTSPTSSVFTVGNNIAVNNSGNSHVAYCFADVKGFSKFGSYTGNGSADGTFIYLGFKPAFVIFKQTDTTGNWALLDSTRSYHNVANHTLATNLSNAESAFGGGQSVDGAYNKVDIVSNGIKIREASAYNNTSNGSYIYMAFAENPFVSSTGIPTTAR